MRKLAIVFAVLAVAAVAAQTPEKIVSYQDGTITVTPNEAEASMVAYHTLKCGASPGSWTAEADMTWPQVQMPLSDLLPSPGVWHCVATASNAAGESGESPRFFLQLSRCQEPRSGWTLVRPEVQAPDVAVVLAPMV